MFAAVMGLFVVGLLAYAIAQLRVGLRDLSHAFAIRLAARRARGGAGTGVLLRGRARAPRLLSPPAGGEQVIAWAARGAYGFGDDAEAAPFVLHGADGDPRVVHVAASRLVLLAEEVTDTFSNRVRALAHDAEVLVYGVLEHQTGRVVLKDIPGRGVVVAGGRSPIAANLGRAALALVAVVTFGVVAVVAHMP